jgi:hypothetical protein
MDHKEVLWEGINWIFVSLDTDKWQILVNIVVGSIKCVKFLDKLRN